MLRTAARRLLSGSRGFMTSAARLDEAPASTAKEFRETWLKVAPSTMVAPEIPSNFLSATATGESLAQGDLFPVNFYTPHGVIASNIKKDTVVLPGINGYFGLKANHVPTIAQLKPGMVELHSGTDVDKYFVAGGFAFVHPNGVTDICVLEAAPLDQIDAAAVKAALATASSAQVGDEYDAAVNRTAIELYGALDSALDNKA